ncbi:hypothetical protein ANAPRD1_00237 [Anaplasma phagocytophilum]|nr:hypothetical protein ANAPRD1_00237 [Anaplasma phagocytophilum]SCV66227.1 hypothetical protein ANAPH2_01522 [Anaplasma phagocytophilum]
MTCKQLVWPFCGDYFNRVLFWYVGCYWYDTRNVLDSTLMSACDKVLIVNLIRRHRRCSLLGINLLRGCGEGQWSSRNA